MSDKKGLSPLIATILLIAFAVAVATVIMTLFQAPLPAEPVDPCEGVKLEIDSIDESPLLCYDPQTQAARFIIKNSGTKDIIGIRVRIVDSQFNEKKEELNEYLGAQDTVNVQSYKFTTVSTQGITADFTPMVRDAEGTITVCPGLAKQSVRLC